MIQDKLSRLPGSSGVYLMKNSHGEVLYVGKAKDLKARLRSYFYQSGSLDSRKKRMMEKVVDFDFIMTESELEALALEASLIKRYKPRFNVILRDDKGFPYLKLTVRQEWPCVEVTRRVVHDGSVYFGPYIPSAALRESLAFIRRNFPIRHCNKKLDQPMRPCLQEQIGRCLGPCSGTLDRDKYMKVVDDVRLFLKGESRQLLDRLTNEMHRLSDEERFEEAAVIRDRIRSIERGWASQRVIAPELKDTDFIGLYREEKEAAIAVFFLRNGMVVGTKSYFFKNLEDLTNEALVMAFIEQVYTEKVMPPPEIVLPVSLETAQVAHWLTQRRGAEVRLTAPSRGKKTELLAMANENAAAAFQKHNEEKVDEVLLELKRVLKLPVLPRRIEAVDISNLQGAEPVGAIVVWEQNGFVKDDYRRFKIKTVTGPDDFGMMREVIERHFTNLKEEGKPRPDMLLIDGGKGQLESVSHVLSPFGFAGLLVAIAKKKRGRYDRVYMPGMKNSLALSPDAASTHLLQRIRDEVHRFAITFHKTLRAKRTISSPLEAIPGVGRKRRLALLKHFGSLEAIRKATLEELMAATGMGKAVAARIKNSFAQNAKSEDKYQQFRTKLLLLN